MMIDLCILAAEPSGDLHGAQLIQELLDKRPSLRIAAVAGPHMRKLPITEIAPMESLEVMGFLDILFHLPRLVRQFFFLRNTILKLKPKALVCIDYPEFNLRLEKSLRKKGFKGKLIHYICPSVWAWRKKRAKQMEKNLDLLLCIFPFEKTFFSTSSLNTSYIGNPLVEKIENHKPDPNFREIYQLSKPVLALFPGSRKAEIENNLPLQLEAAKNLCKIYPDLQIAISIASKEREAQIWSLAGLKATCIPPQHTYSLMHSCHMAFATSGTVTLELALHRVPSLVTYAIKPIDLFLAQKIFRIHLPFYSIVNILASSSVYPEFFGPQLTAQKLLEKALHMFESPLEQLACQEGCDRVKKILTDFPSQMRAANQILELAF